MEEEAGERQRASAKPRAEHREVGRQESKKERKCLVSPD